MAGPGNQRKRPVAAQLPRREGVRRPPLRLAGGVQMPRRPGRPARPPIRTQPVPMPRPPMRSHPIPMPMPPMREHPVDLPEGVIPMPPGEYMPMPMPMPPAQPRWEGQLDPSMLPGYAPSGGGGGQFQMSGDIMSALMELLMRRGAPRGAM